MSDTPEPTGAAPVLPRAPPTRPYTLTSRVLIALAAIACLVAAVVVLLLRQDSVS
jgi:hypothetical protein